MRSRNCDQLKTQLNLTISFGNLIAILVFCLLTFLLKYIHNLLIYLTIQSMCKSKGCIANGDQSC